jgi:hypothetical protein
LFKEKYYIFEREQRTLHRLRSQTGGGSEEVDDLTDVGEEPQLRKQISTHTYILSYLPYEGMTGAKEGRKSSENVPKDPKLLFLLLLFFLLPPPPLYFFSFCNEQKSDLRLVPTDSSRKKSRMATYI